MTVPADIANMALDVLSEAAVYTLDEDNKAARLLNRHFDQTRQAELAKRAWVFAIASASVTGTDLATGSGTLNWRYTLPPGALRVLPLTYDGEPDGMPIAWRRQGAYVLSDQDSPRIIRTIVDKPSPDDWVPLFTEVLVAALAIKIAYPLTQKTSSTQVAQAAYSAALAEAVRANAFERGDQPFEASWARQRGDDRYWRP